MSQPRIRATRSGWFYDEDGNSVNVVDLYDGFSAREPFTGSADVTHTFTEPMRGLVFSNDSEVDMTVTIAGDTYPVLAGEVFSEIFESFTEVTVVTNGGSFRAYGRN